MEIDLLTIMVLYLTKLLDFLVANMHIQSGFTEENLRQAFYFFDEDKKNYISLDDLRRVFGSYCNEETLQRIMEETDTNNDKRVI